MNDSQRARHENEVWNIGVAMLSAVFGSFLFLLLYFTGWGEEPGFTLGAIACIMVVPLVMDSWERMHWPGVLVGLAMIGAGNPVAMHYLPAWVYLVVAAALPVAVVVTLLVQQGRLARDPLTGD